MVLHVLSPQLLYISYINITINLLDAHNYPSCREILLPSIEVENDPSGVRESHDVSVGSGHRLLHKIMIGVPVAVDLEKRFQHIGKSY